MAASPQQQLSLPETVQIHCSSVILQEQLRHHQMLAKRITNNIPHLCKQPVCAVFPPSKPEYLFICGLFKYSVSNSG
jgi:hypothetical protein